MVDGVKVALEEVTREWEERSNVWADITKSTFDQMAEIASENYWAMLTNESYDFEERMKQMGKSILKIYTDDLGKNMMNQIASLNKFF